jgi:hypothetical protein
MDACEAGAATSGRRAVGPDPSAAKAGDAGVADGPWSEKGSTAGVVSGPEAGVVEAFLTFLTFFTTLDCGTCCGASSLSGPGIQSPDIASAI